MHFFGGGGQVNDLCIKNVGDSEGALELERLDSLDSVSFLLSVLPLFTQNATLRGSFHQAIFFLLISLTTMRASHALCTLHFCLGRLPFLSRKEFLPNTKISISFLSLM